MRSFRQFIAEGGNIKVGDVAAAPVDVAADTRGTLVHGVHTALSELHHSFYKEHGEHLFGADMKGLKTGSVYAGSSKHLMDNAGISDHEFAKHKKSIGDVDVQIDKNHKDKLTAHLTTGKKLGEYTVAGTKKHGNEVSAVLQNGKHNLQVDFEAVDYHHGEPTKGEQFLHSAHWDDIKSGIKGLHHKMLLNSVAGETHKFSLTHGLRSRTDEHDPGLKEPEHVSAKLFGDKADHSQVHSFIGLTGLIKRHIPPERHQAIYDKFQKSVAAKKGTDHSAALNHMKRELGVRDTVTEEKEETHTTSIIPLMGVSPISHMGHAADLGAKLASLPGPRHVGLSAKTDVFTADERKHVMSRQWKDHAADMHVIKSGGEMVAKAYHSLPRTPGKKVLNIVVGHDRADFAEKLKKSVQEGRIKELMPHEKFHEINIHYPDGNRGHGMSGTKMRTAARDGDTKEFHRHLGPMFSEQEASDIMKRVKHGIDTGTVKVKR